MSNRKIEDLSPLIQQMVRDLLSKGQEAISDTGFTFFITDGLRTMQEQADLYAQGRTKPGSIVTNAKPGESAHNYGLAVDCAFQKDGKLSYLSTLYAKVYPIARSLGFELGADWVSFKDYPHFQHPQWTKIRDGETLPMPTTMPQNDDLHTILDHYSVKSANELIVMVDTQLGYLDEARKQLESTRSLLAASEDANKVQKEEYSKLSSQVDQKVSAAVTKAEAQAEESCQVRLKAQADSQAIPDVSTPEVQENVPPKPTSENTSISSLILNLLKRILEGKL